MGVSHEPDTGVYCWYNKRNGKKNPRTKLTEATVIAILTWPIGYEICLYGLFRRLGVSNAVGEAIRSGRNWKHLYHHHSRFTKS